MPNRILMSGTLTVYVDQHVKQSSPVGNGANYMTSYSEKEKYKWLINMKKNTQAQRESEKMKVTAMRYNFFFQMPFFIYQVGNIVLAKMRENKGSLKLC